MKTTEPSNIPVNEWEVASTFPAAALDAMRPPAPATAEEIAAVWRLVKIAHGDSHQCRYVADFLLAWWNPSNCGGFDLTELWAVDRAISADMLTVFGLLARISEYPPALDPDLDAEFCTLVRLWRPHLVEGEGA